MSGKNMNRSVARGGKQIADKKFCGVCKKAGKSEEEYTSHFTKSVPGPKGVPTCPLILSSVCKCCFIRGHFVDHCPKRILDEKKAAATATAAARATIKLRIGIEKKSNEASSSKNRFDLLRDLEDDEVDPVIVVSTTPAKKTFASVLASPPCAPMKNTTTPSIQAKITITSPVKMDRLPKINRPRRSWADTDSDTEEEDEDEE